MELGRAAWAARTFAYHAGYNALARAAPRVAMSVQRLTRDTGRGRGRDGVAAADYFEAVLADYVTIAKASGVGDAGLFCGQSVLELGPGDTRAFALLSRLEGASAWEGFDAFDIQSRRRRYLDEIYAAILARRDQTCDATALLEGCVTHTSAAALRRGGRRFDVILSRAVLEHVRDLSELFAIVSTVARDDAVWIHKIDLRDHGIRNDHALDFLRFSERAWRAMSSHIDLPNRERAAAYLALGEAHGLHTVWAATTHVITRAEVTRVREQLATPFRMMDPDELRVLGLWLVQVGPRHAAASNRFASELREAPHGALSSY